MTGHKCAPPTIFLVQNSWIDELRADLMQFLEEILPKSSNFPELLSMYFNVCMYHFCTLTFDLCFTVTSEPEVRWGCRRGRGTEIRRGAGMNMSVFCAGKTTLLFFSSQNAYHTLCVIAVELVGALESTVAGTQVSTVYSTLLTLQTALIRMCYLFIFLMASWLQTSSPMSVRSCLPTGWRQLT